MGRDATERVGGYASQAARVASKFGTSDEKPKLHSESAWPRAPHNAGLVRIDDANARLHWYESTPGAERGFCARCGSTLFFRSQRWAGELRIVRSNFTDPVDREPQVHVHYDSHAPWLAIAEDGLPRRNGDSVSG